MDITKQDVIREIIKQSKHRGVRLYLDTQREAKRTWSEVLENIVYYLLRENAVLSRPSQAEIDAGIQEIKEYCNRLSKSTR